MSSYPQYFHFAFFLKSIFQKVYQNYPSVGWSRIFFGAFCDRWP